VSKDKVPNVKLGKVTAALLPPLEEGYNLVHCSCGRIEDPSEYDDAIAYRLMEHGECFECHFEKVDYVTLRPKQPVPASEPRCPDCGAVLRSGPCAAELRTGTDG
jgi:hypothetical protein